MNTPIDSIIIEFFQNKLIYWFGKHGRDLPWRKTRNPYYILVSELMLQQTQVIRVEKEYYYQFLEKFPTLKKLANATEEEVISAWEGLGYYNRARNLHKIAKIIISENNGKVPQDYDRILELPGVGRYTAGAILSFAFELDYPIVDTNVERIIKRMFLHNHNLTSPARLERRIWEITKELLPKGKAWTFNQAILDFGALICIANKPRCHKCPMRSICQFYQAKISRKDSILYWIK